MFEFFFPKWCILVFLSDDGALDVAGRGVAYPLGLYRTLFRACIRARGFGLIGILQTGAP